MFSSLLLAGALAPPSLVLCSSVPAVLLVDGAVWLAPLVGGSRSRRMGRLVPLFVVSRWLLVEPVPVFARLFAAPWLLDRSALALPSGCRLQRAAVELIYQFFVTKHVSHCSSLPLFSLHSQFLLAKVDVLRSLALLSGSSCPYPPKLLVEAQGLWGWDLLLSCVGGLVSLFGPCLLLWGLLSGSFGPPPSVLLHLPPSVAQGSGYW